MTAEDPFPMSPEEIKKVCARLWRSNRGPHDWRSGFSHQCNRPKDHPGKHQCWCGQKR